MSPDFWASLIEKGATVALAVFAILMLQREFRRQLGERDDRLEQEREERREERAQLVGVIERNTEAWRRAMGMMAKVVARMEE